MHIGWLGGHFDEEYTPSERSEEHTSELQSRSDLVCRLLLEKKKKRQLQGGRDTGRSHCSNEIASGAPCPTSDFSCNIAPSRSPMRRTPCTTPALSPASKAR